MLCLELWCHSRATPSTAAAPWAPTVRLRRACLRDRGHVVLTFRMPFMTFCFCFCFCHAVLA